jgi:hypothetical protein
LSTISLRFITGVQASSKLPILIHAELQRLSQAEFGAIANDVMNCVFDVHNRFGRLFHEQLEGIHWINVAHGEVSFRLLRRTTQLRNMKDR